jgi:hypothetical protein
MRRNKWIALVLTICWGCGVYLFAATPLTPSSSTVAEQGKVWVIIKPLQCLDNPWEQDWLAKHKRKIAKYPRQDERKIIKAFFAAKGVTVWDIRSRPYVQGTPLCKTCGCARGDTLYLSVNGSNVPLMKSLGYDRILPEDVKR